MTHARTRSELEWQVALALAVLAIPLVFATFIPSPVRAVIVTSGLVIGPGIAATGWLAIADWSLRWAAIAGVGIAVVLLASEIQVLVRGWAPKPTAVAVLAASIAVLLWQRSRGAIVMNPPVSGR